jgi:hypothetical protein
MTCFTASNILSQIPHTFHGHTVYDYTVVAGGPREIGGGSRRYEGHFYFDRKVAGGERG